MERKPATKTRIYWNTKFKTLAEYEARRETHLRREAKIAETFVFDQDVLDPKGNPVHIWEIITMSPAVSVRTVTVTEDGKEKYAFPPARSQHISYLRTLVEVTASTKTKNKISVCIIILKPTKGQAKKAGWTRPYLHRHIAKAVHHDVVALHHNETCSFEQIVRYVREKNQHKNFLVLGYASPR